MARRKASAADDIVAIVARLPWWAGVVSAVVVYIVLHRVADQHVPVATSTGQLQSVVVTGMTKALAQIGQYLLPLLLLAGAASSAWRRRERKMLVDTVTANRSASALDGMTWQRFEMLVAESFRREGYAVAEIGGGGPDGGIDLRLARDRETYLVQCKHWKAFTVGVEVVRELYGVMAATGSAGGFVVTSGRFTEQARRFADGRNVTLVDGQSLQARLAGIGGTSPSERAASTGWSGRDTEPTSTSPSASAQQPPVLASTCPLCSGPMTARVAKRGANAGTKFLGCMNYPSCRGTRPSA